MSRANRGLAPLALKKKQPSY